MEGVTVDVYEDNQDDITYEDTTYEDTTYEDTTYEDINTEDVNAEDTNAEDTILPEAVIDTTSTSDDTPNVRPKRAASKRALENIRAVLDWEHCSKKSTLFKSIEKKMNKEFDALNKKRNFDNISTHINNDKVEDMQKLDSLSETWDTDNETFTQNSSEDDNDDCDDDDYSVGSFVVSDSADVEYDDEIADASSVDDDCSATGDDDGISKCSDDDTDDLSDDNSHDDSDEDTVSLSYLSTSSDEAVMSD
jgi:hypothetical protein